MKKDLKKWIKNAFDYQNVDNWKENYKRTLDYLKGDYPSTSKYRVFTQFNLLNLIVPNLYYQDPYIKVKAKRKYFTRKVGEEYVVVDNAKAAVLMENVLNCELKKIGFKTEMRKCIQDALVSDFGILKVGYSLKTVSDTNIEYIKDESIFVSRVPPLDFGFDPIANGPEDARYLIHRIVKPLEEVKEQYGSKAEDLSGEILDETKKKKRDDSKEDAGEFCTLYEVHDQQEEKIYLTTKEKNKTLDKKDNPHDFTGSHFIVLKFCGDNDSFRGISLLQTIEDESLAINETVSLLVQHLRMFPGMILHEKGALDDDEIDAFEHGEQGAILQVAGNALREGRIKRESPVPMGGEYFAATNILQTLIDRVLGVPDFQRTVSTKRKTATEVTYEQADSTIRREYFLDFVKEAVLNVVGKVAALIQQYYTQTRIARIEGDFVQFIEYTNEDIKGEYDFDFDVDSMRFNQQAKFNSIVNGLNILGTHAQIVPAFRELLMSLDGKLLGKELWKQLGLNFDAFTKDPMIKKVHDPYEENDLAIKGHRIADPLPNEDHVSHFDIHRPVYMELMVAKKIQEAQELLRHMQMHSHFAQSLPVTGQMEKPAQPAMMPETAGAIAAPTERPEEEVPTGEMM